MYNLSPVSKWFNALDTLFVFIEPTDNASVSFVQYKGDYYVSTETNFMHKVDPETLMATEKVSHYHTSLNLHKSNAEQTL